MGLLMVILIVAYGSLRLITMLEYGDIIVQQPVEENAFDVDFVFDSSYGFRVAFGLTTYDKDDEPWDESYGKVTAK